LTEDEAERLRILLAHLTPDKIARLEEIIEADKWRERSIYFARQTLIWIGLIGGAIAALKAMGLDLLDAMALMFRGR